MTCDEPSTLWMERTIEAYAEMRELRRSVLIEVLLAWAAKIECSHTSLSLDCASCPLRPICPRYGTPEEGCAPARPEREWWAVDVARKRVIG
jgi:hypothetical protein